MMLPNELLIHEGNWRQFVNPVIDGETKMHGLIPRDFSAFPTGGMRGIPRADVQKIPRSEWSSRIAELVKAKALLSDLRMISGPNGGMMPSRDQNGRGYCWAHSTVSAALLARAKMGLPYADLSAYAIACIIKGYRDEGGWNGESMQFLQERGCPTSKNWAQQSTSRSNDNPATWAEAALYKMTMRSADIADRDFDTLFTYLLLTNPCPIDENWWSHSICAADPVDGTATFGTFRASSGKIMDLVEFEQVWEIKRAPNQVDAGGYGVRIWNSWGEKFGTNGMAVLTESKATPNGSIALEVMRGSVA